ncbi:MAG: hypothetical protein ACKO1K_02550, partial [Burkholderiales bacterium]
MIGTTGSNVQQDRRAVLRQFPILLGIATGLVCLGLLAAPFRSSAGLRATSFVFAFLILAFICSKTRNANTKLVARKPALLR